MSLNILDLSFINKTDLIAKIAEDAELTKKSAEAALNAFIGAVEGALKKGDEKYW